MGKLARTIPVAAIVAAALMAVPSGAGAATQIGETFAPTAGCTDDNTTRLQSISAGGGYAAPSDGVITQWNFQAGSAPPQLKFKVARPAPGADLNTAAAFTIIGESAVVVPVANILNSYFVQIPVKAGDVIGFYVKTPGDCIKLNSADKIHFLEGDVAPPTMATFNAGGAVQNDESAILEPDCDKDGLGDQTQDKDLSSCAPGTTPTGPAPIPPGTAPPTCKGLPATILGTEGNDVRIASQGQDVIVGLGGNDTLSGLGGNDVICGGAGKDTLKGGAGKDTLLGQAGKDTLQGGGSKDFCKGGKGKDTASKCEVQKSI